MAEPLTSQAWVAAWLQKASHDLETAERALHAGHDPSVADVTRALQTARQFHDFVSSIVSGTSPTQRSPQP